MTSPDIYYHLPVVVFDLDDTLYKERDYLFSACDAVEEATGVPSASKTMREAFSRGENIIDAFLAISGSHTYSVSEILDIYRFHIPSLRLPDDSRKMLETLRDMGIRLYIITDGRSLSQRNKIKALGLNEFIPSGNIFISEETGHDKSTPDSFREIVRRNPEASSFTYIGDNPAKDFIMANLLGWQTIMLTDKEGLNIHSQTLPADELMRPGRVTDSLSMIPQIVRGEE